MTKKIPQNSQKYNHTKTGIIPKNIIKENNHSHPLPPYSDTFFYLPRYFDLKEMITKNGKKERFFYHYAFIISSVYLSRFMDKKYTKDTFVPINIDTARTIISQRKCVEIVRDLVDWGVLECDYKKKVGVKSYGYKFTTQTLPPYSDTFFRVKVKDKLIISKMNNFKERQRNEAISLGMDYEHLFNFIHDITINYTEAIEYINKRYTPFSDDYETRRVAIELISSRDIFFTVDKKGYRVHTNLTNLASDLRQFIRYKGKKLGQVDLRNSQPFLLNLLIKNKINFRDERQVSEYNKYKDLTERGEFYSYLMSEFGEYSDIEEKRQNFKKVFFGRVFFDVNRKQLKKEEELFKNVFPTIFSIIREIKKEDYTQLAISLQKIESSVIITECVRKIRVENPTMFIATIHDSLVGEISNLKYFKNVVEDVFIKYNLKPTVKLEKF
jgi:hypothetical protein